MYKLLLASDIQSYAEVFYQTSLFENMGFRAPRVVKSIDEALDCMARHHIDAIGYRFFDQDQEQLFYSILRDKYPYLPIYQPSSLINEQEKTLFALRTLLNRTHADFSNDNFYESDMLTICRHEFFRNLLSESLFTGEEIVFNLLLLRSSMNPHKACMIIDMDIPDGEEYFHGKWRYGADRLETALRNFFSREMCGMRILPSVISPNTVRLLACPLLDNFEDDEHNISATSEIREHVEDMIKDIKEYLLLDLKIKKIKVLPNLLALASAGKPR